MQSSFSLKRFSSMRWLRLNAYSTTRFPIPFPTRSNLDLKDLYLLHLNSIPLFQKYPALMKHIIKMTQKAGSGVLLSLHEQGDKQRFGEKFVLGNVHERIPREFTDKSNRIVDIAWNALSESASLCKLSREFDDVFSEFASEHLDSDPKKNLEPQNMGEDTLKVGENLRPQTENVKHSTEESETNKADLQFQQRDDIPSQKDEINKLKQEIAAVSSEKNHITELLRLKDKEIDEKQETINSLKAQLAQIQKLRSASKQSTERTSESTAGAASKSNAGSSKQMPHSAAKGSGSATNESDEQVIKILKMWDPYLQFLSWFKRPHPSWMSAKPRMSSAEVEGSSQARYKKFRESCCSRGIRRN